MKPEYETYKDQYRAKVMRVIRDVGQWTVYTGDKRHPLVLNWDKSLKNLEGLIHEIK
jgi:hypothetical protein